MTDWTGKSRNGVKLLGMSKTGTQPTVHKWDNPSSHDSFGREPFVNTIVKTIQSAEGGFNLGISARWGEGKSSILEQLKPKLEAINYKVLIFEPWKYTQDSTSIKRKFLIDIYSQLNKPFNEDELYGTTQKDVPLNSDEYQDLLLTRLWIFAKLSGTTSILFIFLLKFVEWFFGIDINITQIFLTNLFIPVLAGIYPLVAKLTEVTVKQTLPKVESAEQFEKRFEKVVSEIMGEDGHPERIIIFVDDLDRCNHTEVEQILTALFTFFNNKHCTYVITADHTVIRRYISHFLQLEDILDENGDVDIKKTMDMRQKEATEYLKKIFQINFIVPKIPNDLLEQEIEKLLDANPIIGLKNPYARGYLVNMILSNFQGNPRKIKHFIRTLAFQLEAISEKISTLSEGDEQKNLTKVKESPELLAKTLIIQDRFPDFYERLVSEPRLLQRHEEGQIADDKELQNLIAQEPRFFNSSTRIGDNKTIDPYYFLYFSGSTGYVEVKAVDPSEIKSLARSGDFGGLVKIITGLTDEPRNAQVELIKKEYDNPEVQPPEKVNIIRGLLHVIGVIEEPTVRLQKLKDLLETKTKHDLEFSSLQSVDFDKIVTFLDTETAAFLLTQNPFNTINVRSQLLEAFINKQMEVPKEIFALFITALSEGVLRTDGDSFSYLQIVSKLSEDNIKSSDSLQDSLLDSYVKATDSLKQQIYDVLVTIKLSSSAKKKFEGIILNTIEKSTISESLFILGTVPTKLNKSNFDIWKLVSSANQRLRSSDLSETEQLINILTHPAIKTELGGENIDRIYAELIDEINLSSADKKAYIRNKLPDLIADSKDKKVLIKRVVQSLEGGVFSESSQTLPVVQGMSDFWSNNPDLKKFFASELKDSSKKLKDKDLRNLLKKSSLELVPPPESKKK